MRNGVRGFWPVCRVVAAVLLSSCVYGPMTPQVRVRNHAAHNLRVTSTNSGGANERSEVVYPGNFSRMQDRVLLVHAPNATLRVAARDGLDVAARGYEYRRVVQREIGNNNVIFEVMVDNEDRTWVYAQDGTRVPFPSERMKEE